MPDIVLFGENSGGAYKLLIPAEKRFDKDTLSRLRQFAEWLETERENWYEPNLAKYRDELLRRGLQPQSVRNHLSTIRARYRAIIRENHRTLYESLLSQHSPAESAILVDEIEKRIRYAIEPGAAKVKALDPDDMGKHLRLTKEQAETLMAIPGTDTLKGLRDTAIFAFMLCTGLRAREVCSLKVEHLRYEVEGELCVYVLHGKGGSNRIVPYGDFIWCLELVDRWLEKAKITEGHVFRRFWRGEDNVSNNALTVAGIEDIFKRYPIYVDGRFVTVRPHDLRRTYARRLYDTGMPTEHIQQNLGHAQIGTTLIYIGALEVPTRAPQQSPYRYREISS